MSEPADKVHISPSPERKVAISIVKLNDPETNSFSHPAAGDLSGPAYNSGPGHCGVVPMVQKAPEDDDKGSMAYSSVPTGCRFRPGPALKLREEEAKGQNGDGGEGDVEEIK
jgi:hypothetical protein